MLTEYVRKPRLGREGANISIVSPGSEHQTDGVYGEDGYVYQPFDPPPGFDGYCPALGASVTPRPGRASARPSGWSPTTVPRSSRRNPL